MRSKYVTTVAWHAYLNKKFYNVTTNKNNDIANYYAEYINSTRKKKHGTGYGIFKCADYKEFQRKNLIYFLYFSIAIAL